MDERYVFVYGTLKKGQPNHHFLKHATFVGNARISGGNWAMFNLGPYPAISQRLPMDAEQEPASLPAGEIYSADPVTVAALDMLEGHPDFYDRMLVRVVDDNGNPFTCVAYYMFEVPQDAELIPSGEWT